MSVNSDLSVEDTIREVLVDDVYVEVPSEQIGLDDGLLDVLGVDSLGLVELRARCEAQFGVQISNAEFSPENFRSVRTVADLVRRLR